MKVGAEDKKKQIAAGVLGVLALGLVGYNLFGGGPSAPPPAPAKTVYVGANGAAAASGPAAVKVGTTSAQLDPSLHEEAMLRTELLVYTGSGRNIFAAGSVAPVTAIPVAVAPARKIAVVAPLPPPPQPTGPPPPPPINLKFFGTATAMNGTRRAFLLNGDDVFVASVGDVVQRRYRVISIASASIMIEDIPNNNKQNVPLTGN